MRKLFRFYDIKIEQLLIEILLKFEKLYLLKIDPNFVGLSMIRGNEYEKI